MEEKVYKPIIKSFMGIADVRVIQDGRNEYVVCKDMFEILGLVKEDGTWDDTKNKMIEFLKCIDKAEMVKTFYISANQKVECLNVVEVPIILAYLKPEREEGQVFKKWSSLMRVMGDLLSYHESDKNTFQDKDN